MSVTIDSVHSNVRDIAAQFARDGLHRRERRHLERDDFSALAQAGLLHTGMRVEDGGLWDTLATSARPFAEIYRTLAGGDSSVALVSTMHPGVLSFWQMEPQAPTPYADAFRAQREAFNAHIEAGHWFGTIASEPGSAGDLMQTRATATEAAPGEWRMSGAKHMGSGSGITSFMMTVAKPVGEDLPEIFMLDTRGRAWDGSEAIKLVSEWDGIGMAATQSHAFIYDDMPAERYAWPRHALQIFPQIGPFITCLFAAVTVGVADSAVSAARDILRGRLGKLKSYEETEWAAAEHNYWLMQQALNGMLNALEQNDATLRQTLHGKFAVAELAESLMSHLSRAIGGRAFSRSMPFAQWGQDVRALGFLRPPWALAHERLFELITDSTG